ncbi:MAG: phosphate acyltransferase PlsX [Ruminococcaceae bacterium]|nr:phosphate acyltransferase PlsX [Oscillospiraceae bacterium]
MNIIIDAMGGDHAPEEIVHGAADAAKAMDIKITLVGDSARVEPLCEKYGFPKDKLEIVHADTVLTMEDDPMAVVRSKKDCSMGVGLRLLKESGDAFVSAGNTGALHAGSTLIIRPFKGIHRPAIATVLPFARPVLMLDSGANTNVTPEYLEQWARLGSIYMKNIHGVKNPRVGLLSNGTEEHKGTEIMVQTHKLLKEAEDINFIGNVEGSMITDAPCDVLVTDGFTGNVTLKVIEGMGKLLFGKLKTMYSASAGSKVAYLLMKDQLRGLKKEFDSTEYGGAPLIGLSKPVIKAHGNSNARAIYNAIKQAATFAKTGSIDKFEEVAAMYRAKKEAAADASK